MLSDIRREIDEIDAQLVPLIERRLLIASSVAEAKRAEGRPIDDPDREAAILERVSARVSPACADSLRRVYQLLFEESKSRQRAGGRSGA